MNKQPHPGTREAIEAGCICPVEDNHHGEGIPLTNPETGKIQTAYWMDAECPLHGLHEFRNPAPEK